MILRYTILESICFQPKILLNLRETSALQIEGKRDTKPVPNLFGRWGLADQNLFDKEMHAYI